MILDPRLPQPPIIIGGCGRSGTTLLLSILSAHPALAAVAGETEVFCPTAWSGNLNLKAPFEIERLKTMLAEMEIPATAKRWLEKSPKNVLFFGRILEFFDDKVRLIHIVRDGRDVVTSFHPTRRREKPWVSPSRWLDDLWSGKDFEGHPQVKVVRYEDLVTDFEATAAELCAFMGEELHPNMLEWHRHATVRQHVAWSGEVKKIHSGSIKRWQKPEFKPFVDKLLADPRAEELLKRYGYLETAS